MAMTVSIWLVGVLAASAALKARSFGATSEALATYAVPAGTARRAAAAALIAAELAAAIALAAGAAWAPGAAAALFAAFATGGAAALLAGRGGRPCACFGGSSRLSWSSPLLALAPAAAAAALAAGVLPRAGSAYESWLTLGLSVAIAGARRPRRGAARARARGRRAAPGGRRPRRPGDSPGGPAARRAQRVGDALAPPRGARCCASPSSPPRLPAVRQRRAGASRRPAATRCSRCDVFDEVAHADVWRARGVPGSPYAVALDARRHRAREGHVQRRCASSRACSATAARARERGARAAA